MTTEQYIVSVFGIRSMYYVMKAVNSKYISASTDLIIFNNTILSYSNAVYALILWGHIR